MSALAKHLHSIGIECPHTLQDGGGCGNTLKLEPSGNLYCNRCSRAYRAEFRSPTGRDYDGDLVYEVIIVLKEVYGT